LATRAAAVAMDIRAASELVAARKKARSERWRTLYEARRAELGLRPDGRTSYEEDTTVPGPGLRAPDVAASDEEWGNWVRDSTDMDEVDAWQQAMLDATAQLLSAEEGQAGNGTDRWRHKQARLTYKQAPRATGKKGKQGELL
jgi:hypothetical protein